MSTLVTATASRFATSENGGLTTRQVQAVAALVEGHSWASAAERSGCSLASIKRWHQQPEFKAAIAAGQREALATAAGKLASGCTLAVSTLTQIAANPEAADSVRVRASEVILNSAIKAYELGELQRKIETLEAMLNVT